VPLLDFARLVDVVKKFALVLLELLPPDLNP
jgi:hypothetical protein